MPTDLSTVQLGMASHSKAEVRLVAAAAAHASAPAAAFSHPPSGMATAPSNVTESAFKAAPLETLDWEDLHLQERFAALERKIGRGGAAEADLRRYHDLRASRRAWIGGQSYLSDYREEERQKAILRKLVELRELIQPVSL